jgi:hypothetical protein
MGTAASSRKSPDAGGIGIELFGVTKRFLTPAGSVWESLREEVQRAYARNTQPALATQTTLVTRPGPATRPGPGGI